MFKETIASLNDIFYTGYLTGELKKGVNGCSASQFNFSDYTLSKINAIKLCDTNANTQGCWSHAGSSTQPGFILANGAAVTGIDPCGGEGSNMTFKIDWDGAGGPNIEGDDQMVIRTCLGNGCPGSIRSGQVNPHPGNNPNSYALFVSLFE